MSATVNNDNSPAKPWSRSDWLILLLFAALVGLFYWPILTPNPADRQSFPPGDFSAQFWAFSTFEVRELSQGRLPLWNPYTFAGAPFWADVQSAVFYPPSLLTLLLSAPWGFSLFALEVEAIAHFWLAALFMYLFMRRATRSRAAALISALVFTFSGYLTGYPSQQLAVLETVVWLPLVLYFIHRAGEGWKGGGVEGWKAGDLSGRTGLAAFWSTFAAMLPAGLTWGIAVLAGHPQSALIVAYVSTAYLLFLGLTAVRPARNPTAVNQPDEPAGPPAAAGVPAAPPPSRRVIHVLRFTLHTLLFLVTGLALAAIQFIPAVEYTRLSVRAAGVYDNMAGGFPLTDTLQLLLPGLLTLYSPLYVGVAGLILAMWAAFGPAARGRHTFFWAALAFVALLLSFGGNTFLYSPLYLLAPGFSIFRGQERWAVAVAFGLAVLAGYGFKALLARPTVSLPPFHLSRLTLYLFLLALLLTLLSFYGLNDTGWTAASPFYDLLGAAVFLTLLLGLAWLLWRFSDRLPPPVLTGLAAALICFDLFTVNWQTNLYPQPPEWHTRMPAAVAAIKQDAAKTPGDLYRVYNEFRLYDNYGLPFEIEDLWGASPLRPARYDRFLAPPTPIERAWELLNVKYVITWREELYVPSTIIYQEPAGEDITYVHRLADPGPRAWLVTRAETADDPTTLQKIADPAFTRWQVALLEPGSEPALQSLFEPVHDNSQAASPSNFYPPPSTLHPPLFTIHNPQFLSINLTTPVPALLILSEVAYPGWQATVDGRPAPILRADYLLRAVPVPAGEHRVDLRFRPLSFTVGAIISGITLLFAAVVLVRQKIGR